MKIEIKNISIKSLILSAFPLLVFAFCLVNYITQLASLPDLSFVEKIVQVILLTLTDTLVWLLFMIVAVFVYNLFCSFGIKGLTFTVEEPGVQEEAKQEVEEKI